jgi:AcrR family transcriptional regulator
LLLQATKGVIARQQVRIPRMNQQTTASTGEGVDQSTLPMRSRLRERMKRELREIALEMFIEHGFDNVSSEQIARKAGVSQRTFYRMFETKEEVLLAWLDHYSPPITRALRDAPSDLPPLEALRVAFIESARIREAGRTERDALVLRLIAQSARLRASYSERIRLWARDLAVILADRAGSTLASDPGPLIWATAAFAASTAGNDWALEFGEEDALSDLAMTLSTAFDRLSAMMSPPPASKPAAARRRKRV